ncbi:uncharacterized protein LOC116264464 [Nymphaea colorata]|nr:uncharacterized protein LOC116264464 [Nymphaea colorata]XP_031500572.1 uncharacterized protein LOC116264464 [Nymphaea colorata]
MASGGRFDPASGSPKGSTFPTSYSDGLRSSFAAGSLDRSSSFHEGSDSRMTGSGSTISGDASSYVELSQWLNLDSLSTGDQKFTRLGELKKASNISSIMLMEDDSFGTALHSKPLCPPLLEDLKRLKSSIIESSIRAKDRKKYLVESISKLDKYMLQMRQKRQRNEQLPTERSNEQNQRDLVDLDSFDASKYVSSTRAAVESSNENLCGGRNSRLEEVNVRRSTRATKGQRRRRFSPP